MSETKNPFIELNQLSKTKYLSVAERTDGFEACLNYVGAKKTSDLIGTKLGSKDDIFVPSEAVQNQIAKLSGQNRNIALSASGDPLLNGTSLITGVIEQVTPYVQSTVVRELFPEAEYAAQRLLLDVFDPIVGMSHNTAMDEPVPIIKKRGIVTEEFTPSSTQEGIVINQQELLFLRNPGDQNISVRGLATYMAMWSEQLTHRGNVKQLNDIYTAIFDGEFYWKNDLIDYGIPSGNTIHTNAMSGSWGTISSTAIAPNAASNPILDLTSIFNVILQKYRGMKMKLILNNRTNALIAQNPTFINRNPMLYANNNMVSPSNVGGPNLETILKYFLGADLGIEVIIDNSTYIADENDPNGFAAGTINPILPDYKMWIYIDTDGFGKPLGEYAYTLATQKGGTSNPKAGKYFYMTDSTLSNTFEGISQPRINLAHGWNGSPRIMRPNDMFVIDVHN